MVLVVRKVGTTLDKKIQTKKTCVAYENQHGLVVYHFYLRGMYKAPQINHVVLRMKFLNKPAMGNKQFSMQFTFQPCKIKALSLATY